MAVRLTEVEAYDGPDDPGSHAYRGRTRRNAVMFGPSGVPLRLLHLRHAPLRNVVVGPVGDPAPCCCAPARSSTASTSARARRRGSDRDLARGPARLCQALGIDLSHDGTDLSRGDLTLTLTDPPGGDVSAGPRVGLRQAADRPWRFWLPGEPTVSTYRPAAPLRRRPG